MLSRHRKSLRSKITTWSLNIAILVQILLGAFTTGIAAAGTGRSGGIAIAILGGLSTLSASYLAKARGSGEPEASSLRLRDLENYVRELEGVILDRGHMVGPENNTLVDAFRTKFEEIMGNTPPGVNLGGIMRDIHTRLEARADEELLRPRIDVDLPHVTATTRPMNV
ncbi:hypothetical protein BDW22DRAFT_612372 [Trametopsis cervina]|nr:hypothetical protein BDW22DRAFT_612372 [Trametopsis cervina]